MSILAPPDVGTVGDILPVVTQVPVLADYPGTGIGATTILRMNLRPLTNTRQEVGTGERGTGGRAAPLGGVAGVAGGAQAQRSMFVTSYRMTNN